MARAGAKHKTIRKKTVAEKCYIVSVGNKFKTEISSVSNIKSLRMTIMT